MSNKQLSDFGITNEAPEFEKETQTLAQFVGQTLRIESIEFKNLGARPGVIFNLVDSVKDKEGVEWKKVHTSKEQIVKNMSKVKLEGGDILSVNVIGGKGSYGKDWYDIN